LSEHGKDGELFPTLPDVDLRVPVALFAEDISLAVAAAVAPDVEGAALFAERLSAPVAEHHGVALADLASAVFHDRDQVDLPSTTAMARGLRSETML
jgi:hypothetical protein